MIVQTGAWPNSFRSARGDPVCAFECATPAGCRAAHAVSGPHTNCIPRGKVGSTEIRAWRPLRRRLSHVTYAHNGAARPRHPAARSSRTPPALAPAAGAYTWQARRQQIAVPAGVTWSSWWSGSLSMGGTKGRDLQAGEMLGEGRTGRGSECMCGRAGACEGGRHTRHVGPGAAHRLGAGAWVRTQVTHRSGDLVPPAEWLG